MVFSFSSSNTGLLEACLLLAIMDNTQKQRRPNATSLQRLQGAMDLTLILKLDQCLTTELALVIIEQSLPPFSPRPLHADHA